MNPKDLISTVKIENGKHQAYFTLEGVKHDLGQFVKLGQTWRSEKYPQFAPARTLSEATLWVAEDIAENMYKELLPQIMPVEYRVVRTYLVLTEKQAHAVWDVLVQFWGASPEGIDRARFVRRATDRHCYHDPRSFSASCSDWGGFCQTTNNFSVWVREHSEVMRYKALVANIALQDLYIQFFG